MPRELKDKDKETDAGSSSASVAGGEKARPGTSGTELLLTTNRREATKQLQRAQRAEQTYRARKRASAARDDLRSARTHLRESARHLKAGISMLFSSARSLPYMFSDKREERRRARSVAARKKLEERLARESGESAAAPENAQDAEKTS